MRKFILTFAIMIAMVGTSFANEMKVDSLKEFAKMEIKKDSVKPNVISLYDVERILIENPHKSEIKIYDCYWNLIASSNEDMDLKVTPGNYYVSSIKKIKGKYIVQ